ncbi:hypothetical protein ACOSP6_10915 [Tenacibaculum sp. MEBiC06402]|uniref:hypothetical protein n=1 Tax=unclassified Tenacibaculum TaxID=2635139 RepID=UPI003B9B589F
MVRVIDNVEKLRDQLTAVANVVKCHEEVAKKHHISTSFLRQIRKGDNAKLDNQSNRELLSRIISSYRSIGIKQLEVLENTLGINDTIENTKDE